MTQYRALSGLGVFSEDEEGSRAREATGKGAREGGDVGRGQLAGPRWGCLHVCRPSLKPLLCVRRK